ncbi:hypothetical protein WN944_002318 [Citrus x changshan-huyou]|uniref:25S rRNA (uridine-N(3))-methyltransferase BMT5-like domain-containing protein n=1 Tax=Citrus x changshan-huyou TaxID=2935761 RepID=A0AAP0QND8_9ROSI
MITELIETSRKASRVQVDSNQAASRLFQAASRLENCPKPESKRLAAWSRKFEEARSNFDTLKKLGASILHGVDATEMKDHPELSKRKFDRIIFNFPHAGFHGREDDDEFLDELHNTRITEGSHQPRRCRLVRIVSLTTSIRCRFIDILNTPSNTPNLLRATHGIKLCCLNSILLGEVLEVDDISTHLLHDDAKK